MSPAPWAETLHMAAAVIITRAHCCLTDADHCYVMLGTIKFVDKSVSDNSAHCDVIALRSGFGVPTGMPHSEVELQIEFKSFTAAHLYSDNKLLSVREITVFYYIWDRSTEFADTQNFITQVYIYTYIHIYAHIYIYIYTYAYAYAYTYTYVHIYRYIDI